MSNGLTETAGWGSVVILLMNKKERKVNESVENVKDGDLNEDDEREARFLGFKEHKNLVNGLSKRCFGDPSHVDTRSCLNREDREKLRGKSGILVRVITVIGFVSSSRSSGKHRGKRGSLPIHRSFQESTSERRVFVTEFFVASDPTSGELGK